jgi:hypothetical protein
VRVESAIPVETPDQIFERVYRELKPNGKPARARVQFRKFANANSSIRLRDESMEVNISDVLENAPPAVIEALAHILVSKLARKVVGRAFRDRYRRYLNGAEVRRHLHRVRQSRGRKLVSHPKGTHFDLEELFEDLNFRFFHGLMVRPELGWSLRPSRRILGHYDPSHNAIVLSRFLDTPAMPKLVVEYVMFHEMLHLRHPVEHRGARRCVHTPEFKEAEGQFPELGKVKELLKGL